ncbi:MAG: glutamate synthase [Clostridiales bacterium]|jgi:glutamate synthase domain-containing protein 3|nr:glutamate synthase [Clostridiales bacterium]
MSGGITVISAEGMNFKELNDNIRAAGGDIRLTECFGQRYIAAGLGGRRIIIEGTPGNALAAYMDGAEIIVNGNVQDAVGDTMNDGRVIVHGGAGDALGYGMRGGRIFIKGQAGYRAGIHMKEYKEKTPLIIIGTKAGSFLGEYMAGGALIVLGIGLNGIQPVGNFTGTGMHGGVIYIRSDEKPRGMPAQVTAEEAGCEDIKAIERQVREYADIFNFDINELLSGRFFVLRPNARNPYHTLYTPNLR